MGTLPIQDHDEWAYDFKLQFCYEFESDRREATNHAQKGAPPPYDCQAPDTERRTNKQPLSTIGGHQQHIHFVGKARAINVSTSVEV